MKFPTRAFELPVKVRENWDALCAAFDAAARPYIKHQHYTTPLDALYNVIGAEEAMDRAMDEVRRTIVKDVNIHLHGGFRNNSKGPYIEIMWRGK